MTRKLIARFERHSNKYWSLEFKADLQKILPEALADMSDISSQFSRNANYDRAFAFSGTYPGSGAFQGGVLLPDGRVFCVPNASTTAIGCAGAFSNSVNFSKDTLLSPYLNNY